MEAVGGLRQWSPGEGLGLLARRYGATGIRVVPCHHPAILGRPGRSRAFGCSCGIPACPAPAEHPVMARWVEEGTSDRARMAAWWRQRAVCNVGLLTGGAFEVLEVPQGIGEAGCVSAPPSRHVSGGHCPWLQPLETSLPEAHLVLRELLDVQDELAHAAAVDAAGAVGDR